MLNNPPFHSHRATTDTTARRMFGTARAALREGGELWVVGNRHLGYHVRLRRLFGNCEVVASDPKFVVLRAVKQLSPGRARAPDDAASRRAVDARYEIRRARTARPARQPPRPGGCRPGRGTSRARRHAAVNPATPAPR